VACKKVLAVSGAIRKNSTAKGARRLASKFGPVSPAKYGSKTAKGMPVPDMRPKAAKEEPQGMFDFANSPFQQKPAPSGLISTQGLNRQAPRSATGSGQTRPAFETRQQPPSPAAATASLRTKKLSRVADTDWHQVTTEADTKYFYNTKTGESVTQLPASVVAHIGRILAKVENDTVARNPAQLPPNLSRSSAKSATTDKPPTASSSSSTAQASNTSFSSSGASSPGTARAASDSVSNASEIIQRSQQNTQDPKAQANIDPSTFAPIAPAKPGQIHEYSPLLSVRESVRSQYGTKSERLADDGTYRFEFSEEEKKARLEALRDEYRQATKLDDFEMSPEELEELMQEEANDLVHEEDNPDLVVPAYYSRVKGKAKAKKSEVKEGNAMEKLVKIHAKLAEEAERAMGRANFSKIIADFSKVTEPISKMVLNGASLSLREEFVFLSNSLIICKAQLMDQQWNAAKQTIEKMTKANPSHPFTYLAEAQHRISLGEFPEAVQIINKALDIDPNNITALLTLAEIYFEINDLPTCEDVVTDVLKLEKKNYKALILASRTAALQGDIQESNKLVQKAILSDGSRPEAYVQEARLLFQYQMQAEGMGAIAKALDCDADHVEAYTLLGNVFVEGKNWEDAEKAFLTALKQHGRSVEALLGLGVINYNRSNWPRLLELSSKAVEIDPGAIEAWFHKGRAELELKHFQMAVTSFERCISYDSEPEETYMYLGVALHGAGRTAECVARMDQCLVRHPKSVKARINKAFALQTMGKYDEAMTNIDEAIALDPMDIEAKMGRVSLLMALGKTEEASKFYSTFQNEQTQPAFEAAKNAATQSHAAQQARHNAARDREMSEDELEAAKLEQEAAMATEEAEKAMAFAPTPEDLSTLSLDQIQSAMNATSVPEMSREQLMSDLQKELARVNGVLNKVGIPSLSLDGSVPQELQSIDTTNVSPDDLQEYSKMMRELHDKVAVPNPNSPEEWDLASSLGLTPDTLAKMKENTSKTPLEQLDQAQKKIWEEEDKELNDWMHRTVAAHRAKTAAAKIKKSSKDSL
jgi:tetratricopeptide (TPR) repeat protein